MFVVISARAQPEAENIDFPQVFSRSGAQHIDFLRFFNIWAEVGIAKGAF